MHSIKKTIHDHEYTLYGVNADLVAWVGTSEIAQAALGPPGVSEDDLFRALGSADFNQRVHHAKSIIEKLWYHHPALGPYPFLETLSEFQFGAFYAGYRDHVCHQLNVYLLGLLAYDGCSALKAGLDASFDVPAEGARSEFLLRWLITAVYHDIGYVLEADGAADASGKEWLKTVGVMNECLAAPLSMLPTFSARLTRDEEKAVIVNRGIFTQSSLQYPAQLEKYMGVQLLDTLSHEAELAGLGVKVGEISPLRAYYDYAMSLGSNPEGRQPFRDHGVASALLLLRTWRSFNDYVGLIAVSRDEVLLKDCLPEIDNLARSLGAHHASVRAAAAAMALHNISPKLWNHGDALGKGLTFSDFKINLSNPTKKTPLAFLLGLIDTLQDWDRPRFRPKKGEDDKSLLSGQDISVTARGDKLVLYIPAAKEFTAPATNPASPYSKAVAAMKEYLEPDAVDALVGWAADAPSALAPGAAGSAGPIIFPVRPSGSLPNLGDLDPLGSARQSSGELSLFVAGTELVKSATRRVALVASTPILVVGTRPYDGSGEPPFYEKEQLDEYMRRAALAAAGQGVDLTCVTSIGALRDTLSGLDAASQPTFAARLKKNLTKLHALAEVPEARCSFRWAAQMPMTFLVVDDHFMIWVKTTSVATGAKATTWLTAQSELLANALYQKATSTGDQLSLAEVLGAIGLAGADGSPG